MIDAKIIQAADTHRIRSLICRRVVEKFVISRSAVRLRQVAQQFFRRETNSTDTKSPCLNFLNSFKEPHVMVLSA